MKRYTLIALVVSANALTHMGVRRMPLAPISRMVATKSNPVATKTVTAAANWRAPSPAMKVLDGIPLEVKSAAATAASVGGFVAFDIALRRFFLARAVPFPSSLAGMLGLFGALCTMQAIRPKAAAVVAGAAQPGCDFISRWLALFFVPNLVLLPLVINMSLAEAGKLLLLIVVGLGASLPLAAATANAALGVTTPEGIVPTAWKNPKTPPNGAPAFSPPVRRYLLDPPLGAISALSAAFGALALASARGLLPAGFPLAGTAMLNAHFLLATVCGFVTGGRLPKKYQKVLHPLISCTVLTQAAVALFSLLSARPVVSVLRGYLVPGGAPLSAPGNLLLFMLGPATLSFGFQMFGRRQLMQQSARAVTAVTGVAAGFGLFATALAGRLLHMDIGVRLAALPRQVTAPLAIAISGIIKADPSLAATIVVVTGLLCANFGRAILDAIGVTSPVARGLAMGAAGHGLGTAAMAEEKEAFPFAAIAMALNAALSTVLVSLPAVRKMLLRVAGVP